MDPNEIVGGGPFRLYYAPKGEACPAVEDAHDTLVGGNWVELGWLADDGITVNHTQTVNRHRALRYRGPVKVFSTDEDIEIQALVEGLSAETYAAILNDITVTTTGAGGGAAGFKRVPLSRGFTMGEFAVLFRFPSPEMEGGQGQYYVPRAFPDGNPAPAFTKGDAAGLQVTFVGLVDETQDDGDELGWIDMQHEAVS